MKWLLLRMVFGERVIYRYGIKGVVVGYKGERALR